MTKSQLIDSVSAATGQTKAEIERTLDAIVVENLQEETWQDWDSFRVWAGKPNARRRFHEFAEQAIRYKAAALASTFFNLNNPN